MYSNKSLALHSDKKKMRDISTRIYITLFTDCQISSSYFQSMNSTAKEETPKVKFPGHLAPLMPPPEMLANIIQDICNILYNSNQKSMY